MNNTSQHALFHALADQGVKPGQLVLSRCGHDTGRIYLVMTVEPPYATCVDGDLRPLAKPKKKRLKHLKKLGELQAGWSGEIAAFPDEGQKNAQVRRLITSHAGWMSNQTT